MEEDEDSEDSDTESEDDLTCQENVIDRYSRRKSNDSYDDDLESDQDSSIADTTYRPTTKAGKAKKRRAERKVLSSEELQMMGSSLSRKRASVNSIKKDYQNRGRKYSC